MLCSRHCPYQVEKDKGGLLNASNFCHPYVRSCIFHHSLFSYTGGMVLCCWLSLFWAARLSVKTVGISVLWVCGKGAGLHVPRDFVPWSGLASYRLHLVCQHCDTAVLNSSFIC